MPESPCEKMVAMAAPAQPQLSTRMQKKSRAMFNSAEKARNRNGVLESPIARNMDER